MDIDVEVTSHIQDVKDAAKTAIEGALESIGLAAEGYAKGLAPTDTGNLKNSITHAVSGIPFSHEWTDDNGKNPGKVSGTLGERGEGIAYIGTSVEYAPYVEYGTSKTTPQPFLRPAAENYMDKYKEIAEAHLKNA